jgi:hypothetical protein
MKSETAQKSILTGSAQFNPNKMNFITFYWAQQNNYYFTAGFRHQLRFQTSLEEDLPTSRLNRDILSIRFSSLDQQGTRILQFAHPLTALEAIHQVVLWFNNPANGYQDYALQFTYIQDFCVYQGRANLVLRPYPVDAIITIYDSDSESD